MFIPVLIHGAVHYMWAAGPIAGGLTYGGLKAFRHLKKESSKSPSYEKERSRYCYKTFRTVEQPMRIHQYR